MSALRVGHAVSGERTHKLDSKRGTEKVDRVQVEPFYLLEATSADQETLMHAKFFWQFSRALSAV